MEKQACHVGWGRLHLRGQDPIMAGAAIGIAQLMWVACRASNCLVHVFRDAHLMSIWRFASDPVCLLFCPSSRNQAAVDMPIQHELKRGDNSSKKIAEAALLVITSDGRIWHLDLSNNSLPSNERPAKKRKEVIPCELPKAVDQTLIPQVGAISSLAPKKHPGDVHKDPDVHGSKLDVLYPSGGGRAQLRTRNGSDASTNANCIAGASNDTSQGCSDHSGLKSQWTKLAVQAKARYSKNPKVRLVSAAALLGIGPAVSVASYGPNGIVALLDPFGALNILQLSYFHPTRRTSVTPVTSVGDEGSPLRTKEPTFILFASVMPEGDTVPSRESAALIEKRLFETMFGEVRATSTFGLLQGYRNGFVYTMLLDQSEVPLKSCTRVLCNLTQPIVALLVIPYKSAGQNHEQTGSTGPLKIKDHEGDSLLILGRLGRAILITGVKKESNELEDGPFLPARRNFSWKTKDKSSTAAELTEKGLTIHEWNLNSRITSACMLGPCRLCYCCGSEIRYVDLFEMMGQSTIHLNAARTQSISGVGIPPIVPFSSKSDSTTRPSHTSSSGLEREKWMLKEELVSYIVPVADVVVAIVGRGILSSSGGSRPLVALTARGRLLGVEVSDCVSNPTLNDEIDDHKSWLSLEARREERVKELLQAMSEVTECTAMIKSHGFAITLTLKELANAFPLVYNLCSDQTRDAIHCPEISLRGEAPPGNLSCFLTVTFHPSVLISPEKLSFGSGVQNLASKYEPIPHMVKISVRLQNQTAVALSPYWSLLLELRSLYSEPTEVFSYSTVINRGLGLPVSAHYSHDFLAELPSMGLCPLLASVYLCHLHDPHQCIINSNPPQSTSSKICSQNLKGIGLSKVLSGMTEIPSSGTVSDIKNQDTCFVDEISSSETTGSVCLLLTCYRIDLLSLLRPSPLQSGVSPWIYHKMDNKSGQLEASSNNDHLLGMFLGNVTLPQREDVSPDVLSDAAQVWQELHLGDIMQRGVPSKAADRIRSSAPDDTMISIFLECRSARGSSSILLLFQASSLLLGSLAREALLWRITENEAKFVLQESIPGNPLECQKIDDYPQKEERLDNAKKLVQQLQSLTRLWRNILVSSDSARIASLLDDTGSVIGAVLRMYRTIREHSPSYACSDQ